MKRTKTLSIQKTRYKRASKKYRHVRSFFYAFYEAVDLDIKLNSSNIAHRSFRADIQGLRAIAVLAVVLFHADLPLPGGFIGVDIFFVISGFVITAMLSREYRLSGKVDLKKFYLRRLKRLAPALGLVVVVTGLAGVLLLSPLNHVSKVAFKTGMSAMVMYANFFIANNTGGYFDAAAGTNPFLHTWSLSVEEQFYLFFPATLVIALTFAKIWKQRHIPLLLISIIAFSSFAITIYGQLHPGHIILGFYSPWSRSWEFAAGALVALIEEQRPTPRNPRKANILALTGTSALALAFSLGTGGKPYPSVLTLLPVIGTAFLISAGIADPQNKVSSALSSRPLVRLGDISYSWYLWHWPAIVLCSFFQSHTITILAAFLSTVPAYLSYIYVEEPIRSATIASWKIAARNSIAYISAPILTLALLVTAHENSYWSAAVQKFKADVGFEHIAKKVGCGNGFVPQSPSDNHCIWNLEATGAPIYLIGDSNADHLSEAVISAANYVGSPARIVTKGGCALLGRSWSDRNDVEQEECLTFVDNLLDLVENSPPGVVIIGLSNSEWDVGNTKVGPTRQDETGDKSKGLQYLRNHFAEIIGRLKAKNHKVLLVKPVPKFVVDGKVLFDPQKCATISLITSGCPQKVEVSEIDQKLLQFDARAAIDHASSDTGSPVIDLMGEFCIEGVCSNKRNDVDLYHDAGHLSIRGTEVIADTFKRNVKPLLE